MKNLLTLFLLLIYSPAFSQDIETELQRIESSVETIRNSLNEDPIDSFSVSLQSPNIFDLTWLSNKSGFGDIEYGTGNFQYSYKNNVSPIPLESSNAKIGVGRHGLWQFRFVTENWVSDTLYFSNEISIPDPIPTKKLLLSFWDYVSPDVFLLNSVKIDIDNINQVPDGVNIIPYIGFNRDSERWSSRMKNKLSFLDSINPDLIKMVILQDEPISKGWSRSEMESLVSLAKETDSRFNYTFSFTRTHTDRQPESEYPQNIEIAILNYYPFYLKELTESYDYYDYIETEEEFKDELNSVLNAGRKKAPNVSKWYITAQSFWKEGGSLLWRKWRKPPSESPFFYYNFALENKDVAGIFFYVFGEERHEHPGAKDYPEYLENIGRVFEEIPVE